MLHNKENRILKIVIYVVCILLAIIVTCAGIIITAMIKLKNGRFSFQSYAVSAYAVNDEK